MKKVFYIVVIAFTCAITFTSCTEEEVKPNTELNGGGAGDEPIKKS